MRTATTFAAMVLLVVLRTWSPVATDQTLLDQGWSDAERRFYYATSQGSRMLPLAWFRGLERPGSPELFASDRLSRYGYPESPFEQPGALPLGFAIDTPRRDPWVGVTCAACHAAELTYRGSRILIDGAPSGADYFLMLVELGEAVEATLADRDGARFARFAERVLGYGHATRARDDLHARLRAWSDVWSAFIGGSAPEHPWGPGRLDAFGLIFNRLAGITLARLENMERLAAPVSYPFLWGASWHDRLQWNGSVANVDDLDRLGRNVGQVLGNFASIRLRKPERGSYPSSMRRQNLLALEDLVKRLEPPDWPEEILGPIDLGLAAAGARLYARHCESCHPHVPPDERDRLVAVEVTPVADVGTDAAMAAAYCNRSVDPGRLDGAAMPPLLGEPLPNPVSGDRFLKHVVSGAVISLRVAARRVAGGPEKTTTEPWIPDADLSTPTLDCDPGSALMAYKATPLHGIWATAPYLHNGAVANLYELLLPPESRRRAFWVGSRELDPVKVGLVTRSGVGTIRLDTTLPGNSALGHDYATRRLTESQRWQLVEYLKTL